jgi:hypothetical protein
VYQFYQSQFWTGNEFKCMVNQAMSNNTMADLQPMLASYNLATIPGYSAPDPTFVAYLDIVDWGKRIYMSKNNEKRTRKKTVLREGILQNPTAWSRSVDLC